MAFSPTEHAVANIFHGHKLECPLLQMLVIKTVVCDDGRTIRYTLILSDGVQHSAAIMRIGNDHLYRTTCPAIRTKCIVELDCYVVLTDLPQGGAKHDILLVISVASVLYMKEHERIGMLVKYC